MTRKQFILSQNMSVNDYLNDMIPSSTMVINCAYPDLTVEWQESDSALLFSAWLESEYADLVKFVRSLSPAEKVNIITMVINEG